MLRRAADLAVSPLVHERAARVRGHRPWPMPQGSWVMAQSWVDLLFAHWPLDRNILERVVPPELPLDLWEGQAWLGVTPFEVRNLRLRPTFPVPRLSAFPEINVRTYVTIGGKPGIYFFSLDAARGAAVAAARRTYRLPYFKARMSIEREGGKSVDGRRGTAIRYRSVRLGSEDRTPGAVFRATYRPLEPAQSPSGSLEHWLTERYCLYTLDEDRRILRGEIHHPPWTLCAAEAEIDQNTMGEQIGVALGSRPLLHFATRQDVVFWPLRAAAAR
jgi:uncharacterized protein YqjF (DUF2071 family)